MKVRSFFIFCFTKNSFFLVKSFANFAKLWTVTLKFPQKWTSYPFLTLLWPALVQHLRAVDESFYFVVSCVVKWWARCCVRCVKRAWLHLRACLQAAIDKVKEADRLVSAGKISSGDKKCMNLRVSCMSYSLQGKCRGYHDNTLVGVSRGKHGVIWHLPAPSSWDESFP